MTIYEGILLLKKTTNAMVVYGNEVLAWQYLPKALFKQKGKPFPTEIVFIITTNDDQRKDDTSKRKPARKLEKATGAETAPFLRHPQ